MHTKVDGGDLLGVGGGVQNGSGPGGLKDV